MGTGSADGGGLSQFVGLDCVGATDLGKAGPRCDSDGYAGPWFAKSDCCAFAAHTQLSNAAAITGIRNISASLDTVLMPGEARSFQGGKKVFRYRDYRAPK
jgi:hypothetical protein